MKSLFNSRGRHIANESAGRLYAPSGRNIGRYIEKVEIFVDMNGRYLGEIVSGDRLLSNRSSTHRGTGFGNAGSTGSIGGSGSPGSHGQMSLPGGFEDVALELLGDESAK
jgi:hypothetical protein